MPTKTKATTRPRAKAQPKVTTVETGGSAPPVQVVEPEAMFDANDAPVSPPVEPAPSSEAVEPAVEAPVSAEPAEPAAETPVVEPEPEPETVEETASSDGPIRVRLGQVEGLLHRIPIEAAAELFPEFVERIEATKQSQSIVALQERMLGNEGRCAPVVVEADPDDPGRRPTVIAGIESVSVALNLGLSHFFVVSIPAGDAGAVQHFLAASAKGQPLSSKTDFYTVVRD